MTKIHTALIAINRKVTAIEKGRKNQDQGYSFRGIDDAFNQLHSIFQEEGVIILPVFKESKREERPTRSGGILTFTIVTYEFIFMADDGSSVTCCMQGEGMDSSDKSNNKAFSAALKYALISMFLIPTNDVKDIEIESPEPAYPKQQKRQKAEDHKGLPVMPNTSFDIFFDMLLGSKTVADASALITKTRKKYAMTEDQELKIVEWEKGLSETITKQ